MFGMFSMFLDFLSSSDSFGLMRCCDLHGKQQRRFDILPSSCIYSHHDHSESFGQCSNNSKDDRNESTTILHILVNFSLLPLPPQQQTPQPPSKPPTSCADQHRALNSSKTSALHIRKLQYSSKSSCSDRYVRKHAPIAQFHNQTNQSLLSIISTYFDGKESAVPSHFYRFYWFCCHYPRGNVLSGSVSTS
jgi:hypothetical protein